MGRRAGEMERINLCVGCVVRDYRFEMEIKEYGKQGLIAWSNSKSHSELLASAALQEEHGLYNIDILSLDLQERSKKINVVGNGYTDSPFRCLAWDNFGEKENTYPHGLLFTGMENGSFKLWNPYEMIATYSARDAPSLANIENQTCIVYEEEPEEDSFPVMCAEWNSLKNNFLAFGSTDVLIIDISKDPTDPELVKPGKRNPHDGSYVTSVSWNREVAHILASASENGLVALWDIKTNNSIFQFKDSGASASGNRNVVICWSKNISTQIAVTLDDEKRNELQIWDLRNQKGPVVVIDRSHSKGINAMDWCETDPELILSSSRDGKVVCWNYTQEEEPISESTLPAAAFNVKWSKKLPSIYSVSTDDKTSVYTLSDTNLFSYVPKWYKIPVASTFFGNDAVLTYSEQRGPLLHENRVPEPKNSAYKSQLKAIANLLEGKFDENDNESEISGVLKAKAGGEHEIYDYLGFNKAKIVHQVQKFTGKKREFATGGSQKQKKSVKPKQKAYTQIQGQDALAFFAGIGSKNVEQSKTEQQDNNQNVQYDMVPRNFNWDIGREGLVKQNILIGNYEGAIDAALKCGRTAEALIIAYSVDQNLFNNTLKTFFTETTDNFITDVLKHIAYKDALELVRKYDLIKWKECVALIHTLAPRDKRPALLRVLADRLRKETELGALETSKGLLPENYAPVICYILAEDFAEIANIYWLNISKLRSGTLDRKGYALEYGRRLLAIFEGITVEISDSRIFHKLLKEVAFIALEEGDKSLSHSLFVKYLPANCQRHIDYLVHTAKELEQYKASVVYKPIILPAMQAKKQAKQAVKLQQQEAPKKKNIFTKEEEKTTPHPPPPASKKRHEEESNVGFSPYQNNNPAPKQTTSAPPKKNLNTPPPPPVAPKKAPVQHVEEEPEREREREAPIAKTNLPPPKKGPAPPPPPPPTHSSHSIPAEEEAPVRLPPPKGPVKAQPPPPPTPEKKLPPPPAVTKTSPPPVRKEVYEEEEHYEPEVKQPPPPPKKKQMPPPPVPVRQPEPEQMPVREEPVRRQPPAREEVRPPPPAREEVRPPPRAPLPPPSTAKIEQRRQEEEPVEEPVRRTLPPPPLPKRGPAPPPPRK